MNTISTPLGIFICVMLVLIFLWLRQEVVYAARFKEMDIAQREAIILAESGQDWRAAYELYNKSPNSDAQILDLTKWTHAQFYPRPQEGAK